MPGPVRDDELQTIRALYHQLAALPATKGSGRKRRESAEYRTLMAQIRAAVDARTAKRGDEMIVVIDVCDQNHEKDK